MPYRSTSILPAGMPHDPPLGTVRLLHDQRHVRRKLLHMIDDDVVMLDLKTPVQLAHGDLIAVEGGGVVEVEAAAEDLYEVTPKDAQHLVQLAWHLGNRHLQAEFHADRILILRDHVIRDMLLGLGAGVSDIVAPFHPLHGAYHGHGQHAHHHD